LIHVEDLLDITLREVLTVACDLSFRNGNTLRWTKAVMHDAHEVVWSVSNLHITITIISRTHVAPVVWSPLGLPT
jgi:molybdopterin-guanine dinucleotide biosynthesis protein A